jgi:cytoskeletal protein CcmA (bactofilin family)
MSSDDRMQQGWKSVSVTESDGGSRPNAAAAQPSGTFIGSGALFEGTLTLHGDFRIDSEFRGELSTDGTIVVGPSGAVVGDVRAREVEVFGAVVGDINARRKLVLHAGARLHGDIETACLEIERHAFFQGVTRMTEPQAMRRTRADTPLATGTSISKASGI